MISPLKVKEAIIAGGLTVVSPEVVIMIITAWLSGNNVAIWQDYECLERSKKGLDL